MGPDQKNSQIIGFLGIAGSDPLKTNKDIKPALKLGHHRHASETPFKSHFVGGQIMARL